MKMKPSSKAGNTPSRDEAEPNITPVGSFDVVMTGRGVEVSVGYGARVAAKLARLGKYAHGVTRYEVELSRENNPRQSKTGHRVEITSTGNGSTVRAESNGPDFNATLDYTVKKLSERLRRGHNRLRVHHGRRRGTSVAAATAPLAPGLCTEQRQRALLRIEPGPPTPTSHPALTYATPPHQHAGGGPQ